MICVDIEQNSPEWEKEKLGKPSASNCSKIITNDGKPSKSRIGYLYELAAERVTKAKPPNYTNALMEEGKAREQEARDLFCLLNDVSITTVGVCYKDAKRKFLCSPDGIITSKKQGVEVKNPLPKTQAKYLYENVMPPEYFGQVQFSLYVTGFKVWHFFSYVPAMKPLHTIVKPDKAFHKALEINLNIFCIELNNISRERSKRQTPERARG